MKYSIALLTLFFLTVQPVKKELLQQQNTPMTIEQMQSDHEQLKEQNVSNESLFITMFEALRQHRPQKQENKQQSRNNQDSIYELAAQVDDLEFEDENYDIPFDRNLIRYMRLTRCTIVRSNCD